MTLELIPHWTTLVTQWPPHPFVLQIEVDHPIYLIQNDERMKDKKLTSLIIVGIVSNSALYFKSGINFLPIKN